MGDEHSDDLDPEVDEGAEIETERFADEEDVEAEESLSERDGDLDVDSDHDHDDSM